MIRSRLERACRQGDLRLLDLEIGLFLERLAGGDNPDLLLAATLASAAVGCGHVCYPLGREDAFPWLEPALLPEPGLWRKTLYASPVVGEGGENTPLVLDHGERLYLQRYYRYETEIAADLRARAAGILPVDAVQARTLLADLFPERGKGGGTDQLQAAATALLKPLLILSGGPGTGKTYTVARLLALLQAMADAPLRIGMAAPTGKAATRLEESLRGARQTLPDPLAALIPDTAGTLHRLLGYRPDSGTFRFHARNPLDLDLLILDEASMIDVVLMHALLQALPAATRLILVGDHNQLASVEAGALFGDLCGDDSPDRSVAFSDLLEAITGIPLPRAEVVPPLADGVVRLRHGRRFAGDSGIGLLAAAVNAGALDRVETLIAEPPADLEIVLARGEERQDLLRERILRGYGPVVDASGPEDGLAALERFRILCATRRGEVGVEGINTLAMEVLQGAGLVPRGAKIFSGLPVIIRRNHYDLQLFNGDIGLFYEDEQGRLRVWFRRPDNSLHCIAPARLPEHEPAWGITIHKSQGSEFDEVLLLLPPEESRLLGRELLYTGITRAGRRLTLCGEFPSLATAVLNRTRRFSGLRERIWKRNG